GCRGGQQIRALILNFPGAERGGGNSGENRVRQAGAEGREPRYLPAARRYMPPGRGPDSEQKEILALIEFRIAAIGIAVVLLGEGRFQARAAGIINGGEVEAEEIAH